MLPVPPPHTWACPQAFEEFLRRSRSPVGLHLGLLGLKELEHLLDKPRWGGGPQSARATGGGPQSAQRLGRVHNPSERPVVHKIQQGIHRARG